MDFLSLPLQFQLSLHVNPDFARAVLECLSYLRKSEP